MKKKLIKTHKNIRKTLKNKIRNIIDILNYFVEEINTYII